MNQRALDLESLLRNLDQAVDAHPLIDGDETPNGAGEQFLLVRDGDGAIGFRLEQVAGVVARPRCGRPPRAPRWLMGVFFWDGKMVPLLDWAVLSSEAPEQEVEGAEQVSMTSERAVVLRLQELVFAVAVRDIVGVRRLRLVDGEVEPPESPGADALGSRFSSVLRWQQERPDTERSRHDGGRGAVSVETEVRVVSAIGLLAHRSIARFANPGLVESLFILDSREENSSATISNPGEDA